MKIFLSLHTAYESGGPAPGQRFEVPRDLREVLERVGTNTYADGFFRFGHEAEFEQYIALAGLDPSECQVFLKCAFGDLIFYHRGNKQYQVLNPIQNVVDILGDAQDLGFVMDIALCDRPALENSFMIDVYEEAFPRLGAPGVEEMYAFVPALKLGGSRDAANVQKLPMRSEMRILLQL
jgi:hypothetical protein